MNNSLISIIIPTFNRAHLITETLESIAVQTYTNWECIVVDDGSTDATITVLENYRKKDNRFRYFTRPNSKLKGPSSCRNFGIENAIGDFIIYLDSDDLLSANCLFNRIKFAKQFPTFDFYIFKTELFTYKVGDLDKIFNVQLANYNDEIYLNLFLQGVYPFCVSSVFWKTEKIKAINGFDEEMTMLEDPELHIKAFKNNLKSLTCMQQNADNYYRKPISYNVNTSDKDRLLKNTYYLFNLYLKNYPTQMKYYCLRFFRISVLPDASLAYFFKFYFLYIKCRILSTKQKAILPILMLYKLLQLEAFSGLGFYKLTTKYFKQAGE